MLLQHGVFDTRECKLCDDGVVVKGEYGITLALFAKGYSIDTLMSKYAPVDWHDQINWRCNNQVRRHYAAARSGDGCIWLSSPTLCCSCTQCIRCARARAVRQADNPVLLDCPSACLQLHCRA